MKNVESKTRFTFHVSSLLAPFISFGLLTIFSLLAWLMITTHTQAGELAELKTDSKLLEQALNQTSKNAADITDLRIEFNKFTASQNAWNLNADRQFEQINAWTSQADIKFQTLSNNIDFIVNWIKQQTTNQQTTNNLNSN